MKRHRLNEKQIALVKQIKQYGLYGKHPHRMMMDAGYSAGTKKHINRVLAVPGVQSELKEFEKKLIKQRNLALKRMSQTVHKASYSDATKALDVMVKVERLINDKSTSNAAINVFIRNTDND